MVAPLNEGSDQPDPTEAGKGAAAAVKQAIKNALAAGNSGSISTRATFNNYASITLGGLKAINDSVAKEAAGKTVNVKINFDAGPKAPVDSRITVDPTALAKALGERKVTDKLPLGVTFDQHNTRTMAVNSIFEKYFDNKIVSVVFEQESPLGVRAEFCAKLNLEEIFGKGKQLYFYSYNPATNIYTRISSPNYWVDKNGYAHITAPFGGSIIITDKPLSRK